jgi:serine/threonine protein kinase
MVTDFCAGGELFFHLKRLRRFSEGMVRFYAAQISVALVHLHANNVLYRDLKPENVSHSEFIGSRMPEHLCLVMISDFIRQEWKLQIDRFWTLEGT